MQLPGTSKEEIILLHPLNCIAPNRVIKLKDADAHLYSWIIVGGNSPGTTPDSLGSFDELGALS